MVRPRIFFFLKKWQDAIPIQSPFLRLPILSLSFLIFLILLVHINIFSSPAHCQEKFYSIHIKTVDSTIRAKQEVNELEQKGYDCFYRHTPVIEEGYQYRIFIGRYPSKQDALTTLNILWDSGISENYALAIINSRESKSKKTISNVKQTTKKATSPPKKSSKTEEKESIDKADQTDISDNAVTTLSIALKHFHENNYSQALQLFRKLSENTETIDILFWTGICEAKTGNYDAAIDKLRLLLALKPSTPQVRLELAAVFFKKGLYAEGLEELTQARAFQPDGEMIQNINQMRVLFSKKENNLPWNLGQANSSKKNKKSVMKSATKKQPSTPRDYYRIGTQSNKLLLSAKGTSPDDYASSYYLGKIYFQKGKLGAAIEEWEKYILKAPKDSRYIHLKKQLTLLKIKHATSHARIALKNSKKPHIANPKKSITVVDFRNRCFTDVKGMEKGLSSLIINDLKKIDTLRVTDRIMINIITKIIHPDGTSIYSGKNAARVGSSLLSHYTVWGEFTDISENAFHISSTITQTKDTKTIGICDIKGTQEELHLFEKRIVFGILESIGIHKKDLLPATLFSINKPHTLSFEAFMKYAIGLDYLDKRLFNHAKSAFQKAITLDPNFALAKTALQSTPSNIFFCPFFEQEEIFLVKKD